MPAPTIDSTTNRSLPSTAIRGTKPALAQAFTMCVRLLEPSSIAMNGPVPDLCELTRSERGQRVVGGNGQQKRLGEQRHHTRSPSVGASDVKATSASPRSSAAITSVAEPCQHRKRRPG